MDFPQIEQKILKFWQDKRIFEKLRQKIKGKKRWSFLDGPITANNPMGVHHAWGRTYKDVFQRFKAMQGFDQRFQNGFDCQGLWVEVEVEKELGFKTKKDIEKYGIENFVQKCKERVEKYARIQTAQSIRLGQWMDWDNSYYTMSDENNYAIWHFLKKCQEKELLYKGKDVVPWCPRCGTAISQHEILTEEYQEITHRAIFLKIPVLEQKDAFFLVWTTTPWTLPANVALAVQPEFDYARIKSKTGEDFIVLKEKSDLIENGEIIEIFKGKKLEGLKYKGIFDGLPAVKRVLSGSEHKVILWEEITKEEGTGIVHIAPGCGQEDFQLSKKYNLPVVDPTDEESRYKENFGFLSGLLVSKTETRDLIFDNLKETGLVFKIEDYLHRYPTCWRCKKELIFRLVDEWYISMEKLRNPLIKTSKKIRWIPDFGLERELDWLKNMQDWLISKKRYWGLALPIFECKNCGSFEVVGSKEELKKKAIEGWEEFESHSPHRPWIDKVKIKCQKCGKPISRIADVGNPWLDAGIVPFSTIKYFENKGFWKKWFPAEFICESFPGQFKNWFYVLLVMSQVLEKTNPFKTVLGYATVVDEKGEEMHKSKGNAIWFDEAVEKIGADVMRWMYARQNPETNMRFGYNIAQETKRKLLTLYNSFVFFETYKTKNPNPKVPACNASHSDAGRQIPNKSQSPNSKNLLDKWIISKLNKLIKNTTRFLEEYDVASASREIENFFIEDLSLWYIRKSRKRFHPEAEIKYKEGAQETLHFVLLTLTKIIAPFMPFFAEEMYSIMEQPKIKTGEMPESAHLCDWPESEKKLIDEELEEEMTNRREMVAKVLAKRAEFGIKIRQVLPSVTLAKPKNFAAIDINSTMKIISEEANLKEVIWGNTDKVELNTNITPELKEEGEVREIIRNIQDLRKKAGFSPQDKILIYFSAGQEIKRVLIKHQETILKETRAEELKEWLLNESLDKEKKVKVEREEFSLGIKKII